MDERFLIERLQIDSLENEYSAALYYTSEGYVDTEEEAKELVAAAGRESGTGWPIERGQTKPRRRYKTIKKLTRSGSG